MQLTKTPFEGLLEIKPTIFEDNRGWFFEFYNEKLFHEHGITTRFVQENQSFSRKNVIRGLHLQVPPYEQAKLVAVISGKVLDVVVDLRADSKTFGQVYSSILDDQRHNMLFVPEGFAHGFAALEDTVFFYKCSSHYHPRYETGIAWNDPSLAIDWPIDEPVISEKDSQLPFYEDFLRNSVISPR